MYIIDVGLSCYDQLRAVKARYPLTSITRPYCGLKSRTHRGCVFFFLSSPLTRQWAFYSIAGLSQGITQGESEVEHANAKFWWELNCEALLIFLPKYSLHNRILEGP